MKIHVKPSDEEVIQEMAEFITEQAINAVRAKNMFSWVLSGGSSPRRLFELLTTPEYAGEFPWEQTYFFFGDERFVPLDHEDSNYRMARIAMLDPMNIKPNQVFPVNTSLPPEKSASSYEADIQEFFNGEEASFDLIMLGLGDDAHTASLFPGTDILNNAKDLVASVYLDDKKVYRISFTKTLINQAHCVAFLTFGKKKAPALAHVMGKEKNVDLYPAQLISPRSGNLHWFVDQGAASLISDS